MGLGGLEPPTSPLSGVRSNQLSYRPVEPFEKQLTTAQSLNDCLPSVNNQKHWEQGKGFHVPIASFDGNQMPLKPRNPQTK